MSIFRPRDVQGLLDRLTPDERAALEAYFRGGDRVQFVIKLLEQHVDTPTIRQRVMSRFQLSRRQAYRVIQDALNAR
jgi:hypothetical protein